ncbi:desampylase [Halocalculus aciditolerans]|uniref:MPN domain-containing protein n=1 Tax=Halocalculus aciditolerans TaxID=1383812 RepID=A0A830F1D5_9EURY|nr:desampylase [Halocalculus aciditolerans]GGL51964.1 hypothetical protein GCM10009039_07780 [Halocalculus aciditolerans]
MLVLSAPAYADVLAHARAAAPEECCGILVGTRDGDDAHAMTAVATENAAENPKTTYEIPPGDVVDVADDAAERDEEIVGFYHSHPAGPPHLSETDEREATWKGYHYLLVSLDDSTPFLDAWRWTGDAFAADAVVVR